jgi:hypothetical protein
MVKEPVIIEYESSNVAPLSDEEVRAFRLLLPLVICVLVAGVVVAAIYLVKVWI